MNFQFSISNFQKKATTFLVFSLLFVCFAGCNTADASMLTQAPNNFGLVGYWSMEGGKGATVTDFSGKGNVGTMTNMDPATDWITGKVGKSLDFDGTDDFVNLGSASNLNPTSSITLSAWIRIDGGNNTYRDIISRWDSAGGVNERTYIIGVNNSNALYFAISSDGTDGGASIATDPATATTDTWLHVLGTWDGTTMRLYKNGVEVATALQNAMMSSPNTRTGIGATIGRAGDSQVSLFNGAVDDVRLYNRALSASEALLLFGRTAQYRPARQSYNDGLVFYAPLDEEGLQAKNYGSAGARIGSLTNFALSGSTSNWVAGKRNGALNFDGTNDFVNFGNQSGLYLRSNLSVFAWIKTSSAYQSVVSWGSAGTGGVANGQYGIGTFGSLCGGSGRLALYLASAWRCSASAINDGVWHHVGYTFDSSGNLQYYIDGATSGSVIATGTQFSAGASNSLVFGTDDTTANYNFPFNGSLDEVRIYNRVLSSTEVSQLYADTGLRKARISTSINGIAPEGLVAWHTFDGPYLNTTTSTDRSGQGKDGTLSGTPTPTIGKVGQALKFNGSTSYVTTPTVSTPSAISVAAWVYSANYGAAMFVVQKAVVNSQWQLFFENGNLYWATSNHDLSCTAPSNDNWHHLVATQTGSSGRLYIDGVQCATGESVPAIGQGTGLIWIGAHDSGPGYLFNGKIDDIRIYNKALSAAEVLTLYNQTK